jgi:hypothetical protein
MIYDQGDDGACAPLPSWRRRFWRRWISGAVMVVFGPLVQGLDHCSGTFFYVILFSFFWLCASVVPLGHYVVAEAGCNWYHLVLILIYTLYLKNALLSAIDSSIGCPSFTFRAFHQFSFL